MKIIRILLLITAGITVFTRLFMYENAEFVSPEITGALNIASIITGVICVICALVWIISIKVSEKAKKKNAQTEKENGI